MLLCVSSALAAGEVAKIGSTEYTSLQDAFDAAGSGDTITLLSDVTLTDGIEVAAGTNVTLDLAGHTLDYPSSETTGNATITNRGTLSISDSVGGGTISYTSSQPSFSYATNTITNYGSLTVNGGVIENKTSGGISYVVDNNSTIGNTTLIVNDGELLGGKNIAVRAYANSSAYVNKVEINGGNVEGTRGLWIQLPSGNNNAVIPVDVDIKGGRLATTDDSGGYYLAIYSSSSGDGYSGVDINIEGGEIVGWVALGGGSSYGGKGTEKVRVSGGEFDCNVYTYNSNTTPDILLTGGRYGDYVDDPAFVAGQTYIVVEKDGQYTYLVGSEAAKSSNIPAESVVYVLEVGAQALTIDAYYVTVENHSDDPIIVNGDITVDAFDVEADEPTVVIINGPIEEDPIVEEGEDPITDDEDEEPVPTKPNLPGTGDSAQPVMWMFFMMVALLGAVGLVRVSKQRK